MSKIYIKMLNEDALNHFKKNIDVIAKKIQENSTNEWIYKEFPQPMFTEKKFQIDDFSLKNNPKSKNKNIDFSNSITLYNSCCKLPRYILTDQRFWLWLHFDKFYEVVRSMVPISGPSTLKDMWLHANGVRRGLVYGVLSRCYFRVYFSYEPSANDPYYLTKWIIENPLRFRELTWRNYSSEKYIVKGILKGEKKAIEEKGKEVNVYSKLAKAISLIGSVRLLDAISEEDIEEMTYKKMLELLA